MAYVLKRRSGFDQDALTYNDARPRYSREVFDAIEQITKLTKNARLLEIGPGTGQATTWFAKRGYSITAVELGKNLAKVAREELKSFPKVKIIVSTFEDAALEEQEFDLVYSATAFHWVKPEYKFTKTHKILKPGGHLAIIHTKHVSDEMGDKLAKVTQPIYDKYTPSAYGNVFAMPKMSDLKKDEVDEKLFRTVYFNTFPLVINYSSEEFVRLISTYSPHIAMDPNTRKDFLKEIKQVIDDELGGKATKHYAMTLTIAQKRDSSRN